MIRQPVSALTGGSRLHGHSPRNNRHAAGSRYALSAQEGGLTLGERRVKPEEVLRKENWLRTCESSQSEERWT